MVFLAVDQWSFAFDGEVSGQVVRLISFIFIPPHRPLIEVLGLAICFRIYTIY